MLRPIFYHTLNRTYATAQRLPSHVRTVKVGPRDGLQNEKKLLPADVKISFIDQLSETGLQTIEVTSLVSPKWVPQMADNAKVYSGIKKCPGIAYPVLTLDVKGLESAMKVGGKEVAASDAFSLKNVNCTAAESIERFRPVLESPHKNDIKVRGYVSTVVGCPYQGAIKPLEGGCPYARGASGNAATEGIIYMLHGMGVETGVNLEKLVLVGLSRRICQKLGRMSETKVNRGWKEPQSPKLRSQL
uniref:hydroxymethylglutaryl-CoA lyase n=1 Tax=Glossina pallidipes TaxID=7398 RepID=A0A1B0A919_GLOPL